MFTIITGNEIVVDIHTHGAFDRPNTAIESHCVLGGSHVFNAFAIAADILDEDLNGNVMMIGPISTDEFGRNFRDIARKLCIDTSQAVETDASTLIAFVKHGEYNNTFNFPNRRENAMNVTRLSDLPTIATDNKIMIAQGVCSTLKPSGDAWYEYAKNNDDMMIVYDANIRMPFIDDLKEHRALLTRWAGQADVIKISDADIISIYGTRTSIDTVAREYLDAGTSVVCVTQGRDPALTFTKNAKLETPVTPLCVKNTVGAGDNFLAGITLAFAKAGIFNAAAIANADTHTLQQVTAAGVERSTRHLQMINS